MTLKRHINDIKRGNKGTLFCNKGPLLAGKCCLFAILRLVIDSQCGNTLFPTWECDVPNVGILRQLLP